jgi:hypothetical protein
LLCVWIAVTTGLISWFFWATPRPLSSDFYHVWGGAQALLDGANPYAEVGPGRKYHANFPLLYPLTAVLAAVPLALWPIRLADPVFVGASAGALAWALTRERLNNPQLFLFVSAAYLFALQTSQWSPIMIAAILLPALSPLLACKPHLALALLAAYPRPRAAVGAAVFVAASIAIFPWWPREWLALLPTVEHMTPYVARIGIGGPVLALAACKWRRADARLLLAMACIPHTPLPYETLPLFLVVQRSREGAALSALTVIAMLGIRTEWPFADHTAWTSTNARWLFWCLYVPCLALILSRKNEWAGPSARPASPTSWTRFGS